MSTDQAATNPSTTDNVPLTLINLTEKAVAEIKRSMEAANYDVNEYLVRVGIMAGGCSGFQYNFTFNKQEEVDENMDDIFHHEGVRVVIDKKSALYLDGTTVDYYDGLERRGFVFENPNAVKSCGCGSSFQA